MLQVPWCYQYDFASIRVRAAGKKKIIFPTDPRSVEEQPCYERYLHFTMTTTDPRPRILIVDDMPANISVLAEILEKDHDTYVATNGYDALEIATNKQPDLILLDIIMPGIDGYEVCRTLKAESVTKDIPVIFVTAKNDPWDEPKGLGMGAVDFLTKPVRPQIVRARVKTHLDLKKKGAILKESALKLEQRIIDRTRELNNTINQLSKEVDERKLAQETAVRNARLASLGTLAAGVAHEINNPNNAIGFAAATVTRLWQELLPHLKEYRNDNGQFDICGIDSQEAMDTMSELINEIGNNSNRITTIVTNLKHMVKGDLGKLDHTMDVNEALESATVILQNYINKHTDHFSVKLAEELLPIKGNMQQLEQVFINLIQNGLQSLPHRSKSMAVTSKMERRNNRDGVAVLVSDQGIGIEKASLELITKPFFTTKGDDGGTGLGLSIAKTILNNHHGQLSFTSQPAVGTTATVWLPASKSTDLVARHES